MLRLSQITVDHSLQSRAGTDAATVEKYAELLSDPEKELDAIECVQEGTRIWLWSGFHRFAAYQAAGRETIPAVITKGTKRDALRLSISANAKNGRPLNAEDHRRAVAIILADPEWAMWSQQSMADELGISRTTIGRILGELLGRSRERPETVTGRDGKVQRNPARTKAEQAARASVGCPESNEAAPAKEKPQATGNQQAHDAETLFELPEEWAAALGQVEALGQRDGLPIGAYLEGIRKVVLGRPINRRGFTPPTLAQVRAYCKERGNKIDPEQWLDHYTSNGWKVGRTPMKDWQAAVRQWERQDFHRGPKKAEMFSGLKEFLAEGHPNDEG